MLNQMFEELKNDGGIVLKREILNVEVPPRAKNRREPIRKPKPEHLRALGYELDLTFRQVEKIENQ